MNHGGLGYITEGGRILLPPELIEPLSLTYDSVLFGLYYPAPSLPGYSEVTAKYDFMLTPIHPNLWPKSARLMIRLNHRPGSLKMLTDFFRTKKISVVHGECSRSAHRYATWNFHMTFEDLGDDLEFDHSRSLYKETFVEVRDLQKSLLNECHEALFIQSTDIDLKDPITFWPNTALAYFHNYYHNKQDVLPREESWMFEPFKVGCGEEGVLFAGESKLVDILETVSREDKEAIVPTIVFAELDNKALNLRVGLIPPSLQKRFFEVGISYERIGYPDTCVGLISCVIDSFPGSYNFWRLFNFSKKSKDTRDEGSLVFLIEDQTKPEFPNQDQYVQNAENAMTRLDTSKLAANINFKDIKVSPLSKPKVMRRLERQKLGRKEFTYDVFLSYSSLDEVPAQKIRDELAQANINCYMSSDSIPYGEDFANQIRRALIHSREMCVLCSKNSLQSTWVYTEWGAAWSLNKYIVPILLDVELTDLPERLRVKQALKYIDIDKREKYVREVRTRKDESQLKEFERIYM